MSSPRGHNVPLRESAGSGAEQYRLGTPQSPQDVSKMKMRDMEKKITQLEAIIKEFNYRRWKGDGGTVAPYKDG